MSRPSLYTPEIATTILTQMAEGVPLRRICKDPALPSEATVRSWALDDIDGFAARFNRARMIRVASLSDELLEIGDDGSRDTYVDGDGITRVDQEVVQRAKLKCDNRKWLLSKLLWREFGDRLGVEHSGTVEVTPNLASMIEQGRRRARGELEHALICDDPMTEVEVTRLAPPTVEY